jgi:hypothetical protein
MCFNILQVKAPREVFWIARGNTKAADNLGASDYVEDTTPLQ